MKVRKEYKTLPYHSPSGLSWWTANQQCELTALKLPQFGREFLIYVEEQGFYATSLSVWMDGICPGKVLKDEYAEVSGYKFIFICSWHIRVYCCCF